MVDAFIGGIVKTVLTRQIGGIAYTDQNTLRHTTRNTSREVRGAKVIESLVVMLKNTTWKIDNKIRPVTVIR